MSYTASGSVNLNVNASAAIGTGASVLTAYNVPVSASPITSSIYTSGTGVALTIARVLQLSGTMTTTAALSGVVSLTTSGTADVGGATSAWSHVREIVVFNDGLTTGGSTTDSSVLTWDFSTTVANAWGVTTSTTSVDSPLYASTTATAATSPRIQISAGSCQRFAKPVGSAGWLVDGTRNQIVLGTPGGTNSGTINYRVVVMGD